jgi:hypothetical protein
MPIATPEQLNQAGIVIEKRVDRGLANDMGQEWAERVFPQSPVFGQAQQEGLGAALLAGLKPRVVYTLGVPIAEHESRDRPEMDTLPATSRVLAVLGIQDDPGVRLNVTHVFPEGAQRWQRSARLTSGPVCALLTGDGGLDFSPAATDRDSAERDFLSLQGLKAGDVVRTKPGLWRRTTNPHQIPLIAVEWYVHNPPTPSDVDPVSSKSV